MFQQNKAAFSFNPPNPGFNEPQHNNGFNQAQPNQGFNQPQPNHYQHGPNHGFNQHQTNQGFHHAKPGVEHPQYNPGSIQHQNTHSNDKISNFTSANDPKSVHSRVFVGNLNTFDMTKESIDNIFTRYGKIVAISKHKGYAFVQFTNVFDARKAVAGEDQKQYAGMKIDCNIASEPKSKVKQSNLKRPMVRSSERPMHRAPNASSVVRTLVPLGGEPMTKRPKTSPNHFTANTSNVSNGTNTSSSDILICGRCKMQFTSLDTLSAHKQTGCLLKFSCKCKEFALKQELEPSSFSCATCSEEFTSCWELCLHCQNEHNISIYKEPENDGDTDLNLEGDDVPVKKQLEDD